MNDLNIAAGVILFNPENEDRFKIALEKLLAQFDKVYIFNNGNEIIFPYESTKIVYITEKENRGISYALNRIMECAKKDGYSWVVSMDQDSVIPDGIVNGFFDAINKNDNIGIVCPQVIDKRRISSLIRNTDDVFVDFCITSASCTSVQAWERCGRYDEWMFIDLVDNDFCKRIILSGFKILQLSEWILDQEFGQITPKSMRKQKFWFKLSKIFNNKNIAKLSYKKYVNPIRVYYTNRNIIYINKKLKKYGPIGYENYNCNSYIGFIFYFLIPSIVRAQDKLKVISCTLKGIKDGLLSNPDQWEI